MFDNTRLTLRGHRKSGSNGSQRVIAALCAGVLSVTGLMVLDTTTSAVVSAQTTPTVVDNTDELITAVAAGGDIELATVRNPDGSIAPYDLTAALTISEPNTTLRAAEPGEVIIRHTGTKNDRVIDIRAADVTIKGITITGGKLPTGNGGGINVARGATLHLIDSTVTGNTARDGGGIYVDSTGTLELDNSTVNANTADSKGGGIRNSGTATIVNSTFVGNIAGQGGAVSSPGNTDINHATIVRNQSTSSSSAGVDRNGGILKVHYSIIGDNKRTNGSPATDCSGTPDLLGINLVSDKSGCNPIGPIIVAPPGVGILTDNGGPTFTTALLATTADPLNALDKVELNTSGACVSDVTIDQRGVHRPYGVGCDLGAYERAPLGLDVSLKPDTTKYQSTPRSLPAGTVEVGLTSVAVNDVLEELVAPSSGSIEDAGLRSIALRSIGLRSITIEDLGLRSIDAKAIGLRSIALRSIGLRSIGLRSIGLRSIGLRSIGLRSIPLSEIPLLDGGWETFLAGTTFAGVPLQSLTLEDLVTSAETSAALATKIDGLTLESIDLSNTGLRSIALRSIALADIALRSIPVNGYTADPDGAYTTAWCTILGALCGSGDDQLTAAEIGASDLLTMQLAGGDVDSVPVFDIPLAGLATVSSTGLRSIGLRSIGLRSIYLENTALRSIGLRSIGLRSIDALGKIVDCGKYAALCSTLDTNTFTLGDVPEDGLIGTIGDLLDLAVIDPTLLAGLSLGDLLLAFTAPDVAPWEQLDLQDARLQNIGTPPQPTFDYVATVTVKEATADLAITLQLPPGFVLASRPGETATFDGASVTASEPDLDTATFNVTNVPPGSYELRVPARAGIVIGEVNPASVSVTGTAGNDTASAGPAVTNVKVVEAIVGDGGPNAIASLDLGDLRLAHVTSSEDADLYKFVAPEWANGTTARVLMSDIPDGVDYDLTIYQQATPTLRGPSTRTLSSLGDVRYDLDPADDVFPTDVVDDIALDVPGEFGVTGYVPADISSRRSNADEEVTLPALKPGATYYVAVTSYLHDSSPYPYGLRLRIDENGALPACRAGDRIFPNTLATTPTTDTFDVATVPAGANTLYVTNSQWLTGEVGADAAGQITAAALATAGAAGVVPPVVPAVVTVDSDSTVRDAYAEWAKAANRCNPEARNNVVRAIGGVLDGITETRPGIKNIVLVGGDGVVPMAALPDRTAYSNEATFARDILTDGRGNEVSGALGAGYLLSDDPYATSAGIAISGADHQLYLPDRNVGRLVETGPQILQQLTNFVDYNGRLDPGTLPGVSTATVTGYDFLADGANAVATDLGGIATTTSRTDENWNKVDYLALFTNGGGDIISPNAHYDYESLLPAADDNTYFTNDKLVSTADLTGPNASRRPDRSVIFSMGCHAGLSVSDVQLGVSALDWAELYAGGNNAWLGHTTFGYGDTEIVAYSERLSVLFAQRLVDLATGSPSAPESLGAAIRSAKHDYLAGTLVLSPYDEKILQSFTYYGLPMYTIGGTGTGGTTPAGDQSPAAFGTMRLDGHSGQDVTPVSINLTEDASGTGASDATKLNLVTTDEGSYYEVGGNTVTAQYRPIQPLVDAPIPSIVGASAGFLITSLTSKDLSGFTPRYLRPTIDVDANERRIVPSDGSFPATLQRVTTDGAGGGRLLVAAGQYDDTAETATGRQRLFTSIKGELYDKGAESDGVGPSFSRITGNVDADGSVVFFQVDTASPARRVLVMYRETGSDQWLPLDLFNPLGNTWLGGLRPNSTGPVEFFVQAVDADGDVGISSNKVENFVTSVPAAVGALKITAVSPARINGYYAGPVTFEIENPTATTDNPISIEYSVDAQGFGSYTGPFTVGGDGGHVVFARDSTGSQQFLYVVIDASPPALTLERSPDLGDGWSNGPVTVLMDAVDVGQSGNDHFVYSTTGATVTTSTDISSESGAPIDAASITISNDGTTVVTVQAVDAAGNTSPPTSTTVRIDTQTPTLTAVAAPQPTSTSNGYVHAPVTVTLTGADAVSGVQRIEYSIDAGPVTTVQAATTNVVVSKDGSTTITATAFDFAGNSSATTTTTFKIDAVAPTVTATVTPSPVVAGGYINSNATVTLVASDAQSGVKSIEYQIGAGAYAAYTGPIVISTQGLTTINARATDNVGNVSTPVTTTARVDTVAPTVTATVTPSPVVAGGYINSNATVTLVASDVQSGVKSIEYQIGAGAYAAYTGPIVISTQGLTTINARATDNVGNVSTPVTTTARVDTVAPTVTATLPAPATAVVGESATLTYACADETSGIKSCALLVNGTPVTSTTNGSTTSYTLNTTTAGTQSITVSATDNAGNTYTSAAVTFTVGYKICLLYDPAQAKNVGSNYSITIQLCDWHDNNLSSKDIALTALTIDGTTDPGPNYQGNSNSGYLFRYVQSNRAYTYNLDTTGLLPGPHNLWFTTQPMPITRPTDPAVLQTFATNSAPFTLK